LAESRRSGSAIFAGAFWSGVCEAHRSVEKKLDLGNGNTLEQFEFDAVSDDGKVIAEIKAFAHPEHPREMKLAEEDVLRLALANGERKLLFLIDPLFYQVFCQKNRNNLLQWRKMGIEIVSPFELTNYLEA